MMVWTQIYNIYMKFVSDKSILGYLRITDFGIARIWRPDNSQDTSGTPGYMGKNIILVIV